MLGDIPLDVTNPQDCEGHEDREKVSQSREDWENIQCGTLDEIL